MSCTSCLYLANTAPQDVAINGTVNLGNVVRRFGKNINVSGGNIVTQGPGYYKTDITIDFTGAAGTTVFTVYENGTVIPGATVTRTTAAGTVYSITIPSFITRNKCCVDKTISVVVSGAAITGATASAVSVKI